MKASNTSCELCGKGIGHFYTCKRYVHKSPPLKSGDKVWVEATWFPGNIPGRCQVSIDCHSVYESHDGQTCMSVPNDSIKPATGEGSV